MLLKGAPGVESIAYDTWRRNVICNNASFMLATMTLWYCTGFCSYYLELLPTLFDLVWFWIIFHCTNSISCACQLLFTWWHYMNCCHVQKWNPNCITASLYTVGWRHNTVQRNVIPNAPMQTLTKNIDHNLRTLLSVSCITGKDK